MSNTAKYSGIDFCEHTLTEEDYIIENMLNKGHTLRGPTMTEEECIIEDMLNKGYMLRGPDNESDFQEIAPQTASSKELLRYLVYLDGSLDKPIIVDSGLMKFAVTGIHIQHGGEFNGAIALKISIPKESSTKVVE